jgi:hypothetical protein
MRGPWPLLAALASVGACTNDYDQFDLTGGKDGGATGGAGGDAGGAGTKPCGASCVPEDDPQTGCAQPSCDACAVANATAKCTAGLCAVGSCTAPFADCNASATDGCELDQSKPDNARCGSCANDCTQQGWGTKFSCGSNLVCRCTGTDQCKDGGSGTASCAASGRCMCETTECNPGERCKKGTGNSQICACNDGAACVPGQTCCQTPAGCRDLLTDSGSCGACGRACPSGTQCVSGNCQ